MQRLVALLLLLLAASASLCSAFLSRAPSNGTSHACGFVGMAW